MKLVSLNIIFISLKSCSNYLLFNNNMIPTKNKTFRALKFSNLESCRALKTSNLANKFWVRKRQNLENFKALKLSELESFRPLNTTNLVNGL